MKIIYDLCLHDLHDRDSIMHDNYDKSDLYGIYDA